jgi:hypothetical protein
MGYQLNGRMSEVCSCRTLCPCAVDEPADGNNCGFSWVFHFDRGDIGGTDVSGLNLAILGHHKDKVSDRKVRLAVIVDDQASDAQQDALIRAFTGAEGGPLADLAGLVQEVVGVVRAPIAFDVDKGSGSFRVGGVVEGEVRGFTSRDGTPTTLSHSRLGDLYGSPSYPGRVVRHRVTDTRFGLQFRGRQSTQSEFSFVAA